MRDEPSKQEALDAEAERLRQLQMVQIRIEKYDSDGTKLGSFAEIWVPDSLAAGGDKLGNMGWDAYHVPPPIYQYCLTHAHANPIAQEGYCSIREDNFGGYGWSIPPTDEELAQVPNLPNYYANGLVKMQSTGYFPTDANCTGICAGYLHMCVAHKLLSIAKGTDDFDTMRIGICTIYDDQADGCSEGEIWDLSIPPQQTGAAAALAKIAKNYAGYAAQAFLAALVPDEKLHQPECTRAELCKPFPNAESEDKLGVMAASGVSDAYYLYQEATETAVKKTLAMADSHKSNTASPSIAASQQFSAAELSRSEAAHLLYGGAPGLVGSTTGGFCDAAKPSPEVLKAIDVLRKSALSPRDVMAIPQEEQTEEVYDDCTARGIPIDNLLNATTNEGCQSETPYYGSVRQRLGGMPEHGGLEGAILCGQSGEVSQRCVAGVAEYFGLTNEDFQEARSYLKQEIVAFSRSLDVVFNPDETDRIALRFAGTASDPSSIDPVYYATITRYHDPGPSVITESIDEKAYFAGNHFYPVLPPTYSMLFDIRTPRDMGGAFADLAGFVDSTTALAASVVANNAEYLVNEVGSGGNDYNGEPDVGCTELEAALDVMGLLAIEGGSRRLGRMYFCTTALPEPQSLAPNYLFVAGAKEETGLRVVVGEDGLRCALYGNIEGAQCDLDDYTLTEVSLQDPDLPDPPPGYSGSEAYYAEFGRTTVTDKISLDEKDEGKTRIYVVALKSAGQPEEAGAYKALGGFHYLHNGGFFCPQGDDNCEDFFGLGASCVSVDGESYCAQLYGGEPEPQPIPYRCHPPIPITPQIYEEVADLLEPDREWCAAPETCCAGLPCDMRIPLENELSEDYDPVESSWRHYLSLARQAADEADELGRRYIENKLSVDMRTEALSLRKEDQNLRAFQALDELQRICGTTIDPARLLKLISGNTEGNDLENIRDGSSPSCDIDSECANGICVVGACLVDPMELAKCDESETDCHEDPELNRLAECLGRNKTIPFVTPGDVPLCLYVANGNNNRPCEAGHGEAVSDMAACPIPPTNSEELKAIPNVTSLFDANSDYKPSDQILCDFGDNGPAEENIRVAYPLELVETKGIIANVESACDAFRKSRQVLNWLSPDEQRLVENLEVIRGSNVFDFENVKNVVNGLYYFPWPGGHCVVGYGSETVITSWASGWPCRNGTDVFCGDENYPDREGLFCSYGKEGDCGVDNLGPLCDRLADAVLTAKYLGTDCQNTENCHPFSKITLPVYVLSKSCSGTGRYGCAYNTYNGWDNCESSFEKCESPSPSENPMYESSSVERPFYPNTKLIDSLGTDWAPSRYDAEFGWDEENDLLEGNVCARYFSDKRPMTLRHFQIQDIGTGEYTTNDPGAWVADTTNIATGVYRSMPFRCAKCDELYSDYGWQTLTYGFAIANVACPRAVPGIGGKPFSSATWNMSEWWEGASDNMPVRHVSPNYKGTVNYFNSLLLGKRRGEDALGDRTDGSGNPISPIGMYEGGEVEDQLDKIYDHKFRGVDTYPNQPFIRPLYQHSFTQKSALDAAELICHLDQKKDRFRSLECAKELPDSVSEIESLGIGQSCLRKAVQNVRSLLGMEVLANFPERAVDALRKEGGGAYPATGGEFGKSIQQLRPLMTELYGIVPVLMTQLEQAADDLEDLLVRIEDGRLDQKIVKANFKQAMKQQMANCKTAQFDAAGQVAQAATSFDLTNPWGSAGNAAVAAGAVASAAVICANSSDQISLASGIASFEEMKAELGQTVAYIDYRTRFRERADIIRVKEERALVILDDIGGMLAGIETQQDAAKNALYRALYIMSFQADREAEISRAMAARGEIDRLRYERAHKDAIKMAFIAKKAIEQRLGVNLSELTDPLPLVDAPRAWESKVCRLSPINYDELTEEDSENRIGEFAESYIGDYVTKLENLIEGYQIEYNFHEGEDSSVVSLRDDVYNVRAGCEVPIDNINLLYHAGDLSERERRYEDEPCYEDDDCEDSVCLYDGYCGIPGWEVEGCASEVVNGEERYVENCIRLDRAAGDGGMNRTSLHSNLGTVSLHRVEAGNRDGKACDPVTWCEARNDWCEDDACGFTEDSAIVQTLEVKPGRYRISWYAREQLYDEEEGIESPFIHEGIERVRVRREDGSEYEFDEIGLLPYDEGIGASRAWYTFDVREEDRIARVSIEPPTNEPGGVNIYVGGLMLEEVTGQSSSVQPLAFVETGRKRTRVLPVCEDTTGEVFRKKFWRRECVKLCTGGFRDDCDGEDRETHCFKELRFNISQRAIESGDQFASSGFARGNFNYRIETIGVNFVGTGIRDCEESDTPSSCYAGGFVPYSLIHEGPYTVTNHMGQTYEAPLYTGKIEYARGLAAERYITNPLSGEDRALVEPYFRTELNGRPLDGSFTLRIWEEEGVDNAQIEDVQLIVNYRYWTKFE